MTIHEDIEKKSPTSEMWGEMFYTNKLITEQEMLYCVQIKKLASEWGKLSTDREKKEKIDEIQELFFNSKSSNKLSESKAFCHHISDMIKNYKSNEENDKMLWGSLIVPYNKALLKTEPQPDNRFWSGFFSALRKIFRFRKKQKPDGKNMNEFNDQIEGEGEAEKYKNDLAAVEDIKFPEDKKGIDFSEEIGRQYNKKAKKFGDDLKSMKTESDLLMDDIVDEMEHDRENENNSYEKKYTNLAEEFEKYKTPPSYKSYQKGDGEKYDKEQLASYNRWKQAERVRREIENKSKAIKSKSIFKKPPEKNKPE